jgi:NAD-dependent oxidoreductase involved in siderophore biosynthesis
MGRAFGTLKPFLFDPVPHEPPLEHAKSDRQVFRIVRGQLAGIPATFQSRQSIKDDGWEPVSEHVTVGFPTGNLVMLEAFGPLIWSYRPLYFRIPGLTGTEPMSIQLTSPLSFNTWSNLRIRMLARAIESLSKRVTTGKCPNEQRPYHLMQVSSVWERVSADLHGSSS